MHMQHGKGILSLKTSNEMQSPQTSISAPRSDRKELGAESYGMGFFVTSSIAAITWCIMAATSTDSVRWTASCRRTTSAWLF